MIRLFLFLVLFIMLGNAFAQSNHTSADSVRRLVDIPPQADYNIDKYLAANLRYPADARKHNIDGRVNVQFIVNKDGSISDAKVVGNKHLYAGCEEEAVRLIKEMPKWKPAKVNGQPVKAYYTQPVTFRL